MSPSIFISRFISLVIWQLFFKDCWLRITHENQFLRACENQFLVLTVNFRNHSFLEVVDITNVSKIVISRVDVLWQSPFKIVRFSGIFLLNKPSSQFVNYSASNICRDGWLSQLSLKNSRRGIVEITCAVVSVQLTRSPAFPS